jgi:hypothetical protein
MISASLSGVVEDIIEEINRDKSLMKTFKEFMEEFRYLPKAKIDKKIKDREDAGEGQNNKTQRMKLIRNILGKNTNLSKSDVNRNAINNQKVFNKRKSSDNLSPEKAKHYADTTIKSSEKQKSIIKSRDLRSNKKNPTERDKLKREYELTKQDVKNRSETDTKRIINAKKRLEKSYKNSLDEKIIFEDYDNVYKIIDENIDMCKKFIKDFE